MWIASGGYPESIDIDKPITVRAAETTCQVPASSGVIIDGSMGISGVTASLVDLALTNTAGGSGAVLAVSGADVVLEHSHVSGGAAVGISVVDGSSATVRADSTVADNSGPGISVVGGNVTVEDSHVFGNQGSGIFLSDATLTMSGGTVAINATPGNGGGIHATASSTVILNGTGLTDNSAAAYGGRGGALFLQGGSADLTNTAFADNHAGGCTGHRGTICYGAGGAIFATGAASVIIDADTATCDFDLRAAGCSVFAGNSSFVNTGAAVHVEAGTSVAIAHTTFLDNDSMGGGIWSANSTVTVANSLLVDNTSSWNQLVGYDSTLIVASSTLAEVDTPFRLSGGSLALSNSVVTGEENVVGIPGAADSSCNAFFGADPIGVGDINADPRFIDPWNRDFRLAAGSPAADQCATGPPDDLTGASRPVGSGFDMGSYERPVITDLTPPSWPAGSALTASRLAGRSVELTWTSADDDVAVSTYWVYQDTEVLRVLPGTIRAITVTQLEPATGYHFRIQAQDAVGNRSSSDPELSVTTLPEQDPEGVGFFDPATGQWWLPYPDLSAGPAYFGSPGDLPVQGDWDCNGLDRPGLYRTSEGRFYLRNDNPHDVAVAGQAFHFGVGGNDFPLAGDWNGDGCDTVAVYRDSEVFVSNALDTRPADFSFLIGSPGGQPFAGDFDGDGFDTIGLYQPETGRVSLHNSLTSEPADNEFFFGSPGDRPVAGDWDGDGIDTIGVFRPSDRRVYLSNANETGVADEVIDFSFPESDWLPIAGDFHAGLV